MVSELSALKRSAKLVNTDGPFRVRPKTQLVSIPNHNFQLKVKKVFRVFSGTLTGATQDFSTTNFITAIRNEMGVGTNVGQGEFVYLHDIRVYSVISAFEPTVSLGQVFNVLTVQLRDIEESVTNNFTALFEDNASPAGVCHVQAVYPVNNRPTFTASTPNAVICTIGVNSATLSAVVIDVDATYVKQTITTN